MAGRAGVADHQQLDTSRNAQPRPIRPPGRDGHLGRMLCQPIESRQFVHGVMARCQGASRRKEAFVAAVLCLAVLLVAVIYFIMVYNGLVSLRESVRQAWANIDVLLKQRHDELPKLVETCRQYMQYEQETLQKVMQARAAVSAAHDQRNMQALGAAENQLRGTIGALYAVAENYPQLKADQTFQQLQARISALESGIADRREYYNEEVRLNNIRIAQFPAVLVAHQFGFLPAQLLKIDQQDARDVDVGALFRA